MTSLFFPCVIFEVKNQFKRKTIFLVDFNMDTSKLVIDGNPGVKSVVNIFLGSLVRIQIEMSRRYKRTFFFFSRFSISNKSFSIILDFGFVCPWKAMKFVFDSILCELAQKLNCIIASFDCRKEGDFQVFRLEENSICESFGFSSSSGELLLSIFTFSFLTVFLLWGWMALSYSLLIFQKNRKHFLRQQSFVLSFFISVWLWFLPLEAGERKTRLKVINLFRNIKEHIRSFSVIKSSSFGRSDLFTSSSTQQLKAGFFAIASHFFLLLSLNYFSFLRLSYKWQKTLPSHLINFLCESDTLCRSRRSNDDDDKKFNLPECRPHDNRLPPLRSLWQI